MKNMPKVLIVDAMHESIDELFEEAGFRPHYRPDITRDEVMAIIAQYEGLVVRSKLKVDKELIDQAEKLQFVARAGAGLDQIDYSYLTEKNIKLVNAPEGNRDALGEHTVGMLLSLMHKLHLADLEVKSGTWDREGNRGWELKGKTVGIYGYGFMGSAFAEKLHGFGCQVLAYDKYKTGISNNKVEQVDLDTFQEEVEVLSIHVPLTSETRFLFDGVFLSNFKKLKFILNTSRGEVLKLSAVIDLLEKGVLLGVGLDVLENEKLDRLSAEQRKDFDRLAALPNVLLTPHVAGWTFESYRKINEVIISKLQREGLVLG